MHVNPNENSVILVLNVINADHFFLFLHLNADYFIQDYFIIREINSNKTWLNMMSLTTSQYTITYISYFKTQRTVIENIKVT